MTVLAPTSARVDDTDIKMLPVAQPSVNATVPVDRLWGMGLGLERCKLSERPVWACEVV